mgnify:CR=1 FL=1
MEIFPAEGGYLCEGLGRSTAQDVVCGYIGSRIVVPEQVPRVVLHTPVDSEMQRAVRCALRRKCAVGQYACYAVPLGFGRGVGSAVGIGACACRYGRQFDKLIAAVGLFVYTHLGQVGQRGSIPRQYIPDLPADAVCSWAARYEDDTDFAPLSAFAGVIEITGDQLTL